MKILWLSEDDVKSLLTMDDAIDAVEEGFREHSLGRTQMPPKSYLYYEKYNGDLRTMPAYLEGLDVTGVKIVNAHPENSKKGLPTVMAMIILNSPQTGAPLALMGGSYLTGMRTGAAGMIAAKYLARKNSNTIGIVGSGVQARTQLLGLSKLFEIETVKVADVSLDLCNNFEVNCRAFLNCNYLPTTDVKKVCDCDILVTVTPSRSPVVKNEWVSEGTHINAIGADAKGKQELDTDLLLRAKVVVDDIAQAAHSGEVNVSVSQGKMNLEKIHAQIGDIVTGKAPSRENDDEITIFDSTGLAVQDIATANKVYQKAIKKGLGTKLDFL
ncbi:MAG: alanine dehydrogenase [Methanotrichaceae archaeon]